MTISEYYKYYLTLHQHPKCKLLHFIGQLVTIIFFVWLINNLYWYFLPIVPFVIYPFAWSGHYFFEKNKPAAFHNPVKAKISDWIMFKDILLGRLRIW
tara:strand:+ start:942 stop:1235 length:294 start_codon:yes stop_codon:yes gene_type:complete